MNFIKFILVILGLMLVGFVGLWLFGILSSLLSYLFWLGLIGGIAFVGYKLFTRLESKVLGDKATSSIEDGSDINMSWDEYDKKYLHK